ncbi:MAG: hypothetical protein Q4B60_01605 [Erysipelotrichaceae bacterium]|nr:hypothetical protein [Erysipelotrichaceae bacterium]
MIYTYEECLKLYGSDYQIRKQITLKNLYQIEPGIYSDKEYETRVAIIMKKYPFSVFTLNSAFYYQGLTDTIPEKFYIETDKDAAKITDKAIKQLFDNNSSLELGVEVKKYNGDEIRIFSKERLLIELIRHRTKLSFDYYKEIIGNYRKIVSELDFQAIEEYAEQLPKTNLVMNIIRMEIL